MMWINFMKIVFGGIVLINKPDAPIVKGRKYTIGRHNINWPIPQSAIDANLLGKLGQNPGYDGYDPTVEKWNTWEEAVADEQ